MKDSIDQFFAEWEAQGFAGSRLHQAPQFIYRIARISKVMGERLDATVEKHGLTRSQFEALAALRRKHPEPLCAQDLMEASLLTSGSVTAMINQLLKAGLIERSIHEQDKRRIQVRLTRKGKQIVEAALMERIEDNERIGKLLNSTDHAAMNRLMRHFLAALEQDAQTRIQE